MTDLYVTDEAGIPITSGAQKECELTKLVSNYAKLCEIDYLTAFQEFNEEFLGLYGVDIYKLEGNGTEYQKIISNGLYNKAREVIIALIWGKSNNSAVTQLADIIGHLSFYNGIYKDLINSDPNYIIKDDIPYKRVIKRFTKEQLDTINDYANKHGINPVEAMHELFD